MTACRCVEGIDILHPGHLVIHVTDESAAWELAEAFGQEDLFYQEMGNAIRGAWPDALTGDTQEGTRT